MVAEVLTRNGAKILEPVAMADEACWVDEAGTVLSFWRLTSGAPLSECGISAECMWWFRQKGPYTCEVEAVSIFLWIFRGFP
jgi:hypothetical protein